MKLPVIRSVNQYIQEHNEEKVLNAVDVLEHVSQAKGLSPEEIDVVGELISNFLGSVEVSKQVKEGVPEKDALNGFMQRVLGSIDR